VPIGYRDNKQSVVIMAFPYSPLNLPKKLFINNEYVDSAEPKLLSVYNPVDGSLVASDVVSADERDVDAAVDAAEKALPAWKKVPAKARRALLLKFADLVEQHTEPLMVLSRLTLGSPPLMGQVELGGMVEVSVLVAEPWQP
jgi:aldehyde dehydrogenase (NAD+)